MVSLFLVLLGAAEAAAPAPARLLVQPLRCLDVAREEASALEDALAEELGRRADLRVVTAREIDALAELQRDGVALDCVDDVCLAELTRAAGAQRVLSGSVGRVGQQIVLTLGLVDPVRATPIESQGAVGATVAELVLEVPGLVAALFGGAEARSGYRLAPGSATSFAVFDLEATGVSPDTASNLTQILATQLKQIEGVSVISRADVASVLTLEVEKDRMGCGADGVCLAEIGAALGVEKLVVGSVGRLAGSSLVTLRLIDVREVRVDSRVTEIFTGPDEQLIAATRHAGRRLLGFEDHSEGSLAVSASAVGARVSLDDETRGVLPLPPIAALRPGRHRLRVDAEGFESWSADVYVEPGATSSLWAELVELPRPWYQRWWFWTGAVALVAGSAAAVLWTRGEPAGSAIAGEVVELPR